MLLYVHRSLLLVWKRTWPGRSVCPVCCRVIYLQLPLLYPNIIIRAGLGPHLGRPPPRAYDEYLKAYSVAMLPGRERENVSYGGKSMLHPPTL